MIKFLCRIGSLILAILVVGMIPDTSNWQASHDAYFPVPAVGTGSPSNDLVPDLALLSLPSPAASQSTSPAVAVVQTPEPAFLSAQEMNQEQRYARTAIPSPTLVPTPPPTVASDLAHLTPGAEALNLYVHLPPQTAQNQPLRVLVALHGMGGNGSRFAENLIAECDRNGWVLVAPTMPYTRDYKDPSQLMEEDLYLGHMLHSLIDGLPKRLGLKLRRHVMIIGFSRGAQLAHRFALFHPDMVETVALIAAGSYTMPIATSGNTDKMLAFPLGVGDLPKYLGGPIDWKDFKNISFWIGVGEKDNKTVDVARAFDPYGDSRLTRARTYGSALQTMGVDVKLVVFPDVGHEVTAQVRTQALEFLRKDELSDRWND